MGLRSRNKISVTFNMSSMTDMVFLLLIFFIILSTLVSPYALRIDLPSKGSASNNTQQKITVVKINSNLAHFVDNKSVQKEQLEENLKAVMANREKKSIKLDAAQGVPTEEVVNIFTIAQRNDWQIVLASKKR